MPLSDGNTFTLTVSPTLTNSPISLTKVGATSEICTIPVAPSGKSTNAPNFVTVFTEDDEFSKQAESYVSHICGDKSKKQLKILIGCLKAASKGGTDAVFTAESEGFYALMAQKTEDETDE